MAQQLAQVVDGEPGARDVPLDDRDPPALSVGVEVAVEHEADEGLLDARYREGNEGRLHPPPPRLLGPQGRLPVRRGASRVWMLEHRPDGLLRMHRGPRSVPRFDAHGVRPALVPQGLVPLPVEEELGPALVLPAVDLDDDAAVACIAVGPLDGEVHPLVGELPFLVVHERAYGPLQLHPLPGPRAHHVGQAGRPERRLGVGLEPGLRVRQALLHAGVDDREGPEEPLRLGGAPLGCRLEVDHVPLLRVPCEAHGVR